MRAVIVDAIVLVNDDGIVDIVHDNVSKRNATNKATTRSYSHSILRLPKYYTCYCYILYSCFMYGVAQATNTAN